MRVKRKRKVSKEGRGVRPTVRNPVSPAAPLKSARQADVTVATTGDKARASFDHPFIISS